MSDMAKTYTTKYFVDFFFSILEWHKELVDALLATKNDEIVNLVVTGETFEVFLIKQADMQHKETLSFFEDLIDDFPAKLAGLTEDYRQDGFIRLLYEDREKSPSGYIPMILPIKMLRNHARSLAIKKNLRRLEALFDFMCNLRPSPNKKQ